MKRQPRAVKWALTNYQCNKCEIGIVQVKSERTRSDIITKISGCLNCGYDYGLVEGLKLDEYKGDDMTWA